MDGFIDECGDSQIQISMFLREFNQARLDGGEIRIWQSTFP